jgi:hypothetical protein
MRNGQNKRMRGRNNNNNNNNNPRKGQNPLTRLYESNGPDVKIRGTASHVAEKYIQLARDSQSSGDPVAAENYYQHAEHYFRMIAAAQEQFRQGQPSPYRPEGGGEARDESYDGDDDDQQGHPMMGGSEPSYGNREQPPYPPREHQNYQPRDNNQPSPPRDQQSYQGRDPQPYQPRESQQPQAPRAPQPQGGPSADVSGNVERLPSFITGGGQPQPQPSYGQNGHDNQPDRFPLHRRRRRHRGPRGDLQGGSQGGDDAAPFPRPPQD